MSVKKQQLAKRVPVLIDRELYNWFKNFAETANSKPVSVTSVLRYALQEFRDVTEDETLEALPCNVIDFADFHRSQTMQLQDMN